MKKRTITALATLLFFSQGAWAQAPHFVANPDDPTSPKGTEAQPFLIGSIEDLNNLAADINDETINEQVKGYGGMYFELTANLDYRDVSLFDTDEDGTADSNFWPIGYGDEGNDGLAFKGTFDGAGHTISGITVNQPQGLGLGIFGYIFYPAVIKNLTVANSSFTGNWEVGAIVGASAGSASGTSIGEGSEQKTFGIYNCSVTSSVTVTAVTASVYDEVDLVTVDVPGAYVGGICGFCGCMTVSECMSEAKVTGDESVGGIVGHLMGSTSSGIVENCFYLGGISDVSSGKAIVGGRGPIDVDDYTDGTLKLTLYEDDSNVSPSNHDRLTYYNGVENVDVTISGRTLWGGEWNTICLPFEFVLENSDALKTASLKTLSEDISFADGTLTLNFSDDLPYITTNMPFIIKPSDDVTDPVFKGVNIAPQEVVKVETKYLDFVGNYDPIVLTADDRSVLYLGASNTLYYPSADVTINPFRAHFELKGGLTAGDLEDGTNPTTQSVRAFQLNIGGGEAGIREICNPSNPSNSYFTLDGRKLDGAPTAKGLYINNGNKILMK